MASNETFGGLHPGQANFHLLLGANLMSWLDGNLDTDQLAEFLDHQSSGQSDQALGQTRPSSDNFNETMRAELGGILFSESDSKDDLPELDILLATCRQLDHDLKTSLVLLLGGVLAQRVSATKATEAVDLRLPK